MRTFLTVLGVLAGLFSLIAFVTVATGGSDIQLIAAGVFGTMGAVCFGFAATLAKFEEPRKETPADLARELLSEWHTMDESTHDRLARSLIAKIDATASNLTALEGTELRSRLSSLISTRT